MGPSILARAEHPISRADIDSNVLKVLYRLINSGHVAYLVGGSVRDLMLGRHPKDFDVATTAHPQQVRDLFRNSRLIGRRFRLVHVFFGPQNIEVATFRRRSEVDAPGEDLLIRQDNTFGTPDEDAHRRDFTVNALFYDPRTFEVIDYAGGLSDLRAGLIRTVADPEISLREDPVRMIRAVRFAAKLDFGIEEGTREAIARHRGDLLKASRPRLVEEIFRTLTNAPPRRALLLMAELGLLEVVLPYLAEHLQSRALHESATVRVLGGLEAAVENGMAPSRAFTLACLLSDLYLSRRQVATDPAGFDLMAELRNFGFPRGESERARLLLAAVARLAHPNGRLRGLSRRPYFEEAKTLFTLLADHQAVSVVPAPATPAPGRRRRRRRRYRSRRPREGVTATAGSSGDSAETGGRAGAEPPKPVAP